MRATDRLALLLAAVVAVVALLRFEGPAVGYWDTYITAPAMHITGHEVDFVLRDGSELVDYTLADQLPQDLLDPETFGVISKDQRLGAGMTAAPAFALFGLSGFRLLHGALSGLVLLGGYLLGREVFGARWPAVATALLVALNPYTVAVNRLNPNVFALAGSLVLLALLVSSPRRTGAAAVLAGLLFGLLGNIRPELVLALPGVYFALWSWPGSRRGQRLVLATLAATVAVMPTLIWNAHAFGGALVHSSQYSGFAGFRPTFPHSFLGWTFQFNGLLNWPLHSELVRTPHFPFPTFLLVPLQLLATWGAIAVSAALVGGLALARASASRRAFLIALLWGGPLFLLLLPMENWDELKMTYILLFSPTLALFCAGGLEQLGQRRHLYAFGALVLVLALLPRGLSRLDTPVDERWYVRFPGAAINASGIELLTDDQRRDWEFFHTRESEDELAIERLKLTRGNLLPRRYWRREPSWVAGGKRLGAELGQRTLRVLAVWYYIYGGERDDVSETGSSPR